MILGFSGSVNGQEDLDNQPVPKAVPIEDLQPKFDENVVVISRSRQFKISGSDAATRAAAANLAEDSKLELLRMLEEKDDWKVPVIVEMRGKFGDAVPLRNTVLDFGYNDVSYQVKIFVNLSRGLPKENYQRAVIAACLLARSLQDKAKVDANVRRSIPPWLVEGISEAISWRLGQSDRRLYDTLFRHGGLYKLENLFELNEAGYIGLDAASKAAFRVSAGALVMALSEQPDGKAGMRGFLNEAPSYSGEFPALLRQHFPELNMSQSGLAKWWNLQLANKGTAPLAEALGVAKTDEELERALKLRYRDAASAMHEVPISEWNRIPELTQAERLESVRLTEEELVRLSYRCFPSYRPLLQEYQLVLTRWVAGDTKEVSTSLLKLAETRQIMVAKSARARDFLDWFEITRARETSGAFDDYLTLKTRLKVQSNPRKDSITKYLDRLDPLFVLPDQRKKAPFPLGEF
ncbi:MAG: hypothetical protein V4727_12405 [Verrucomicrobiota bacterium]